MLFHFFMFSFSSFFIFFFKKTFFVSFFQKNFSCSRSEHTPKLEKSSRSSYCENDVFLFFFFLKNCALHREVTLGMAHLIVTPLSCFSFVFPSFVFLLRKFSFLFACFPFKYVSLLASVSEF